MSSSAIIDLTGISQSFPSSLDYEIQRENVWNTTSALFRGGAEIIFIEGDEGLGKTTLMAQLARKDPYKSFTLFVKSASRFTYDTENLRFDLSNQITWLLDMKELGDPADADESYWKNIVLRLHRQARRKNEIYYFIIDGLAELPDEAAKTRGNLLDMLPLGMTQFRFILSGDAAVFPEAQRKRLKYKSLVLSPFILDETYKFFGGLNVSREEIEQIHRTCNGIPGHLASIRRLVASGTGAGQIIDEAFDKLPDLFELEWRKTDPDNNVQKLILAVLAFDKKRHTIGDLQKLLQLEPARVRELLGNLSFIEISPQDEPSYVSETFRRFAAERLKSEREKVDELLIRNMMSMPQSEESLLRLTGYLRKANRYEDILNYLSAENLERLLECTKSLSPVRDKVDLGLETAVHLHRDGEVFRFAIAKAVLTSLYEGYDGKAEIQARISLNDYESAVMLAQRTVLKEDRLHLLAVIAKAKHIQGLEPEPEIVEQIRQLYSEIDFGRLGSRAIEIAADLIGTETQLAIEMVEKAAQTRGGENILDTAFVRLSLAVILKPKNQKVTPGAVEKITERIGNPELRDLIAAIASFTRTSSALEVISLAKTMKQTSEALFVLRQWAMANDTREDAVEVIVYGLERAIGVTDYSPNATVWRELSTPLASIPPNERIKELVGMIDAQKTTVERLGPSEDVVRLQLNLVKAELRYDVSAATSRMVESYFYICSISDLSVKASCLAWLVATLVNLDGDGSIEKKEGVLGIAKAELDDSIKRLIAETAAHFDSLSGVINAICTACPQEALDIAQTLNTQSRRDRALSLIFKSIVETSFGDSEMSLLEGILDRIVNPRYVDESVSYLARDWDRIGKFKSLDRGTIIRMIRMVDRIHDSQYRCKAYARSIVLLKQLADDKLRHIADNEQLSRLNNSWESIDRVWVKSELGFEIASSLATTALETAKEYATKSELLSSHEMLGSSYAADTYIKNLELAVRSFPGLLPRHIEGPNDWKSLEELIGQIPSPGEQAKLWADLAVRCYLVGRTDYCKEIVSKYVRHRLSIIDKADKRYYYGVMRDCATALYLTHHRTALDDMAALPNIIQDEAYDEITDTLLYQKACTDPCDVSPKWIAEVPYETIVDVIEILEFIERDSLIYSVVERIADGLTDRRRRQRYSEQQKSEIARKLESIIALKLPAKNYIQHDGFKIIASVQIARIRGLKGVDWAALIASARKLPNKTDVLYVLTVIATAMPNREAARREQLLAECISGADVLPCVVDRIDMYETIAHECWGVDNSISRRALELAMKLPLQQYGEEIQGLQRRVVDFANKLDPELASSMASLLDNDPARSPNQRKAREEIESFELRQKLVNPKIDVNDLPEEELSDLPEASWRLLASLNADRVMTVDNGRVRTILLKGSDTSLNQAYPILCWAIANNRNRYSTTDQASTLVAPAFHSAVECARLAYRVATHRVERNRVLKKAIINTAIQDSMIVNVGHREEGKAFLQAWLAKEPYQYLKICDPYFGPDDLEVLKIILAVQPNMTVQILTSCKHQRQVISSASFDSAYHEAWRMMVSDQSPPDTEIFIVGAQTTGALPIHDRWWITDKTGIRLGSSYNSLGLTQDSEISVLSPGERAQREDEIDKYIRKTVKVHNGDRLMFSSFTL